MTHVGVLPLDHDLAAAGDIDMPDLSKALARPISFPLCHCINTAEMKNRILVNSSLS